MDTIDNANDTIIMTSTIENSATDCNIKEVIVSKIILEDIDNIVKNMHNACELGNLKGAKDIYKMIMTKEKKTKISQISIDTVSNMFVMACSHGHLPVCQWLYEIIQNMLEHEMMKLNKIVLGRDRIKQSWNMQTNNNPTKKQIRQMEQWDNEETIERSRLLDSKNIFLLISSNAFYNACANGHLPVCRLIYTLCPDVNALRVNQDGFYIAYANGHLPICRWLYSIKPTV